MVKLASSVLLGLLAITAQAGDFRIERRLENHHRKHHHHHHHGTGTAPFPSGNSTVPAGSGTGAVPTTTSVTTELQTSTSVLVSTVYVSPLPAPVAGGNGGDENKKPVEEAGKQSPAEAQCGGTVTVTQQNTVTVTATPSPKQEEAGIAKEANKAPAEDKTTTTTLTSLSTTFVKVYASPAPKVQEKPAAKPEVKAPAVPTTSTTQAAAEKPSPAPAPVVKHPVGNAVEAPQAKAAPQAAAAPAAPKTATKAASSSASSGGKRGIVYTSSGDCSKLGGAVTWSWDWGATPGGSCGSTEYVPTMQKRTDAPGFKGAIAGLSNVQYAKCFNEVDMSIANGGTAISPSDAAGLYKQYMPAGSGIKLGTPSVTSYNTTTSKFTGGASGIVWLQQFVAACQGCQIDFVDLHWYGDGSSGANQATVFLQYVEQAIKDVDAMFGADKAVPIWISEFSALPYADADPQVNKDFLDGVLAELDSNGRVERYSYFMASSLGGGSGLNMAGQAYSA